MQLTALLNYPEFIIAGLVGIYLLFNLNNETEMHCPDWLAQPAINCLLAAPTSYLNWMQKTLLQAG